MERKKLVRKAERPSKSRIRWPRWTGFRGMTLRDWLPIVGALLIPVVIAAGTWGITWQQGKIEDQRAKAERKLAEQRAQDEALQAYLDQMSQLMLEGKLLEAEQGDPVHTLAQARTSTVILRLDAKHNESVTRFFSNSGLTASSEASARLLSGIALSDAKLSEAELPNANLIEAFLGGADLSDAILSDANLRDAYLIYADLSGAQGITNEELAQDASSLKGATMPNGQKYEDWLKDREKRQQDE